MNSPEKPVLIFDGKCGFCRIWIDYWRELTGDRIDYAASQDVGAQYPQIAPEEFSKSVQFVLPDRQVFSGAEAVFRSLDSRWLLWLYERLPGFAALTEAAYRAVASHRDFFYRVTVTLFGRIVRPLRHEVTEWLFRKVLAIIWLVAFLSFGLQASALIGSSGVQPVALYFSRVREYLGAGAWTAVPSLLWIAPGDAMVHALWIGGALAAVLVLFGLWWRAALIVAFVAYLSLLNASQEFLSFQWDILLLETGFLAIFLGYSRAVVWLFRWLLFRLMFLSGAVKLLSGDPTWASFSALLVHFETQPIPTPVAWYVHQLPSVVLKASCVLVLFVELLVPFLVLGPRRVRVFAAAWLIALQLLILMTGNYAFFNWLTIALCLFLLDDSVFVRVPRSVGHLRRRPVLAAALAIVIVPLSTLHFAQAMRLDLPRAARAVLTATAPFGITSSYGLFATMTTTRPEIIIEGSNDGEEWLPYEFPYKPGRLDRKPPWVAPHQPRLDWQMWFAALGRYQENVWFVNLLARLLQGQPEVLAHLACNPFPQGPPKLIRAQLYEYRFTNPQERDKSGDWWTRTFLRPYVPPISLNSLSELSLIKWESARQQR